MITDPASLFAFACFVGILGLLVLILPLMILFWSQMEPQILGLVVGTNDPEDEYRSQAVLPKLMKSFGNLADKEPVPAPAKSAKRSARKPATTSRSKASTRTRTVKAAPAKKKSATGAKKSATTRAKGGSAKPKAKSTAKAKKAARSKSTPAGAKRDSVLGVIYSKKPKEIDDLKQIKGVAKVIEAKLHKAGIYTFRQIVEWDAAAIEAFSERLSFKGRIVNEGWQKQCAKFHKEKYGEKIS